ncbi:MAG: AraC family transcriptional regulator [Lachnospiraceae bacterium]|nr:AraC family transcriptional regulator [Agathobacter sp.]MDD6290270.1 AraC family transcriptional regulator [Lachnospiraceae bacterium]
MYLELKENRPHGTKDFPYTQYHIHLISHAFQIPVHWHDELEIIYVRNAPLTIVVDGEEYTAEAGSIFLVNPGQLHLMGSDLWPVDYFTLLFPLEFISFQTEDALEKELLFPLRNHSMAFTTEIPRGELRASCSDLLEQLIALNPQNGCPDQIGTRILLLQFIQLLVKNNLVKRVSTGSPLGIQKELLSYIQQNYCGRITLSELSSQFHLSQKYISRYFKEHFHLTLSQYLNYLRMTHAKHLLETTSLPVTEIAMQSGFSNVSYFIRAFKENFGMAPLQYRNQL